MSSIEETVRSFVVEHFLFGDGDIVKGDTSFLEERIIDSMGILELVMFLEQTYSVKVDDSELLPQNFDTLDNIVMYLETKVDVVG
jgi:acyl carrier protein